MCGFAGILDFRRTKTAGELEDEVRIMAATLRHRGPDDEGIWTDAGAGAAFGHRRLAVLDLSPAGHQPMLSTSGRYVINYNGEIYNHRELRSELEAAGARPRFAGHSDTEVLLAAIEHYGVAQALPRLNGMFAFALWDRQQRELWLARDRFGEKPLYYGFHDHALLFASELKALRAVRGAEWVVDRDALALYFRYNAVPAPFTIYRNAFKLPPASFACFKESDQTPAAQKYWSFKEAALQGAQNPFAGSESDAVEQLYSLLGGSLEQRLLADVPVGIFLSGGIDSSLLAALAQRASAAPVQTFSIGVRETSYNEAEDAQKVAQHLGTHHTELYVEPEAALAVVPRLAEIYDEPFSDSSQIPTFLLSQLARRDVTVCLSGDGGDEMFGGYNRYIWVDRLWKRIGWMSTGARALLAKAVKSIPPRNWERVFTAMQNYPVEGLKQRMAGDKLHKIAGILDAQNEQEIYLRLSSHWLQPEALVPGAREPHSVAEEDDGFGDFLDRMMYTDSITFLPDDILTKVDRASMAVSLEVRAPYLDAELLKFAWSLPKLMKVRNGKGKWLLRQLLHRFVPAEIVERPKMGFGIPLDSWLRGPLRGWAEELLAENRLRREEFLNPQMVREKWEQHLSGRHNWQYHLWDVLMFQSWLERIHERREAACAAEVS